MPVNPALVAGILLTLSIGGGLVVGHLLGRPSSYGPRRRRPEPPDRCERGWHFAGCGCLRPYQHPEDDGR
jgi:hypothetical protein